MSEEIIKEYQVDAKLHLQRSTQRSPSTNTEVKSFSADQKAAMEYDEKKIQHMTPVFIKDLLSEKKNAGCFLVGMVCDTLKDDSLMSLIKDKDGNIVRVAIRSMPLDISFDLLDPNGLLPPGVSVVIIDPPAPVPYHHADGHQALCDIIYLDLASSYHMMLISDHKLVGNLYYRHHEYEAALVSYKEGIKTKDASTNNTYAHHLGNVITEAGDMLFDMEKVFEPVSILYYMTSALVFEILEYDHKARQHKEPSFDVNDYHFPCYRICQAIGDPGSNFMDRQLLKIDHESSSFQHQYSEQDAHLAAGILHDETSKVSILKAACRSFIVYLIRFEAMIKYRDCRELKGISFKELLVTTVFFLKKDDNERALRCYFHLMNLYDHDTEVSMFLLNRAAAYMMLEQYFKTALSSIASIIISNKLAPKALYRLLKALQCMNMMEEALAISEMSIHHCPEDARLKEQHREVAAVAVT
jgi:tetratricopeptide (TPR) repeat protein